MAREPPTQGDPPRGFLPAASPLCVLGPLSSTPLTPGLPDATWDTLRALSTSRSEARGLETGSLPALSSVQLLSKPRYGTLSSSCGMSQPATRVGTPTVVRGLPVGPPICSFRGRRAPHTVGLGLGGFLPHRRVPVLHSVCQTRHCSRQQQRVSPCPQRGRIIPHKAQQERTSVSRAGRPPFWTEPPNSPWNANAFGNGVF